MTLEELTVDELVRETTSRASNRGYYSVHEETLAVLTGNERMLDETENIFMCAQLSLIAAEVSEAIEAHRRGDISIANLSNLMEQSDKDFVCSYKSQVKGTLQEELADIFIRVASFCGYFGFTDISQHIRAKLRFTDLTVKGRDGKRY